jgi:hypothetical protein
MKMVKNMWYNFVYWFSKAKEILVLILGLALFLTFLFVLIGVIFSPVFYITCNQFSVETGLATRYNWLSGTCFAEYKGIWLPSDQIFQLMGE